MEAAEKLLQGLQLHPVADHFTVALLTVAILIDLVASLFPARGWLRSAALTLTILGALACVASFSTGDMEADRIWKMMSQDAQGYFKGSVGFLGHGKLGYYLMFVFGALAIWRILQSMLGFMAGTRGFYLLVAVISLGFLLYQGHTGGELVYVYGVGTGPMAAGASPAATSTPEVQPTPIPMVFVPTPAPSPLSSAAASAAATGVVTPSPAAGATPIARTTPTGA